MKNFIDGLDGLIGIIILLLILAAGPVLAIFALNVIADASDFGWHIPYDFHTIGAFLLIGIIIRS